MFFAFVEEFSHIYLMLYLKYLDFACETARP
jgi:hypothetical protein